MKKFLLTSAVVYALSVEDVDAQSNPALVFQQVPTAAQWNSYFSGKVDYPALFSNNNTWGGNQVFSTAPVINGVQWPSGVGVAGQVLTTQGTATATWSTPAILRGCITGINFNSGNTDNALVLPTLPTTRYAIDGVKVSNASATMGTASVGVFTSTGGGGQTIAANQTLAITSIASDANGNMQTLNLTNANTEAYIDTTLQIRVGTAQGSAATADVCVTIKPQT